MSIFTEAFAHRLLPYQHEITINAMQQFDKAAYQQHAPEAAAGALLASAVLYLMGVSLRRLPSVVSTEAQQARIAVLRKAAHGWLPYLLILAPTPVGGMLIIASGFFAIRPWLAALMLLVAEAAWRLSPLT